MRLIVFPCYETALLGGPATVKLTDKEANAMRLYHLGGAEAWRTETAHVACKTIDSLCRKGLLDRNGATQLGKRVASACV